MWTNTDTSYRVPSSIGVAPCGITGEPVMDFPLDDWTVTVTRHEAPAPGHFRVWVVLPNGTAVGSGHWATKDDQTSAAATAAQIVADIRAEWEGQTRR